MKSSPEQQIQTCLFLGAATAPLPAETAALLGIPEDLTAVARSLRALAVFPVHQRTGKTALVLGAPIPPPPAPDHRALMPPALRQILEHILKAQLFWPLLPEFFKKIEPLQLKIPSVLLPQILEQCLVQADLKNIFLQIAGSTGAWLAEQNPAWRFVLKAEVADWYTATYQTRLQLLEKMRRQNPAEARRWLSDTWKEERSEHRAVFLQYLLLNYEAADAPLLEAALSDRSKEVQQIARSVKALLEMPVARAAAVWTAFYESDFPEDLDIKDWPAPLRFKLPFWQSDVLEKAVEKAEKLIVQSSQEAPSPKSAYTRHVTDRVVYHADALHLHRAVYALNIALSENTFPAFYQRQEISQYLQIIELRRKIQEIPV